ncbi:MAG: glycosyltransferase [Chromatiaceae bacterium]|nr:MAG: glycosyltransferase [Chromatiaceae bacterium]
MAPDPHRDADRHPRLACLLSTSGHSGVDRLARHLLPAMVRRGYAVDLLKVRGHGPHLDGATSGVTIVDLGSRHTLACLPAIVAYLRRTRPLLLLADKDRVNRLALLARALAALPTRLILRTGTTVSVDLAARGALARWVQRQSMRWLYPMADAVLVPSAGAAADMAAFTGLARGHIQAVPSPIVPAALFSARLPRPVHPWFGVPGWPLLLGVGELSARKDFATLIRAFARLRSTHRCRLLILGEGRARADLLALARGLGVATDLALPGFVAQPYAEMAHADLLVSSSRWEGLPFVPVEALAVGTPVVATDCPSGPREILQDGCIGPLVPVGDDAALAAAMAAVLAAPPARARLQAAVQRFEIEAASSAYLAAMGLPARAPR